MAHFRKFHMSCRHETKGISTNQSLEYYPLTVSEIIGLLEEAAAIKIHNDPYAVNEISSIQVRLDQAIPGQVCPRELDGPVAEKTSELDQMYVDWIQNITGSEPDLTGQSEIVVKLMELIG